MLDSQTSRHLKVGPRATSISLLRMTEAMRWVDVQPDKSRIGVDYVFGHGCLKVSQWSRFNMYRGLDFDGGHTSPKSLDVNLSILDPLWSLLEEDDRFRSLLLTPKG